MLSWFSHLLIAISIMTIGACALDPSSSLASYKQSAPPEAVDEQIIDRDRCIENCG